MKLNGKKIAVLIESDYYEPELAYYQHRFAEERAELHLLSRLWGQPSLTVCATRKTSPSCHPLPSSCSAHSPTRASSRGSSVMACGWWRRLPNWFGGARWSRTTICAETCATWALSTPIKTWL